MVQCREDSIDSWVEKLRSNDILAIICLIKIDNLAVQPYPTPTTVVLL